MIAVPGFERRKVAVLGLARSGLAAANALAAGGAEVLAWDDSEKTRAAVAGAFAPEFRSATRRKSTGATSPR